MRKAQEKKDETEDKPFTCQYCGVEYTVKTITSHYKRSHPDKYFTDGNERIEYKCSQCEEKYFAKSSKYPSLYYISPMYSGLQKNWTFWERGKTFPLF